MKSKNLNASSKRTRAAIKKSFAEMLSEKREISKVSVSELVKRAGINRGTFYSHYDDIYSVAEDFENELINEFFTDEGEEAQNFENFIDRFFDFLEKNEENYKLLCRSNDILFVVKKLVDLVTGALVKECEQNPTIVDKEGVQVEINVFVNGVVCEYVKHCRGYASATLGELRNYAVKQYERFVKDRSAK